MFLFAGGRATYGTDLDGRGKGPMRAVRKAQQAAARDLLETLTRIPGIDRAVVATDDAAWGASLRDLPVEVDIDGPEEPFHFGRRLAALIARYGAERVLYTGGGSAPLLREEQWREVVDEIGRAKRLVVSNNLHSCDWAAVVPAQEARSLIAQQTSDNGIAWALTQELGYPGVDMPAAAGSRFDLDTPADVLIAARHPGIGAHLRRCVDELGWHSGQLDGVLEEMRRKGGSLLVAGRASSAAWRALEESTRCWARVFAEERGMRASGRQGRGEVRSLLADYLDLVGVDQFFEALSELAGAILLDNRVILAARRSWPPVADRFNSDLYRWREVENPFLRRFTRAAAEAPVPVVMGGHSVVAGGLMALTEALAGGEDELEEEGRL